jgi:hypothetical protein
MVHETPFLGPQMHYFAFGEILSTTKFGMVFGFRFGLIGGWL